MSRYYDDGICRYILTDEGYYAVDRCPRQQTELTVLGEINGTPVKAINSFAFNCKTLIKNIVVSEGIEEIGNFAFHMCSSLERVTLPETLKTIGNSAFAMCSELRTIVVPPSVESIGEMAFDVNGEIKHIYVVENSFAHSHIKETYPTLAEKIAFYSPVKDEYVDSTPIHELEYEKDADGAVITRYRGSRSTVRIPSEIGSDEVVAISDDAFSGCNSVKRIILPDTVSDYGSDAFSGCRCLEALIISNPTADYVTVDGVLFCKKSKTLVRYPENKPGSSYNVPAEYVNIARNAFKDCRSLTTVNIPMSVKAIGERAFADCASLRSIELPASLEKIPAEVFKGCRALRSVSVPPRVKSIDASAFEGCSVEEIFVVPGTPAVDAVKSIPAIAGKMKMAPQSYVQSCMPYMEMQLPLGLGTDVDWETVQGMMKDITMPDGTFDFTKIPGISEEMADSINNLMKNLTANGDGIIIPMFNGTEEPEDSNAEEDETPDEDEAVEEDVPEAETAEEDTDTEGAVPAEASAPEATEGESAPAEASTGAPRGPNPPLEQFEADFYSMYPAGSGTKTKKAPPKSRRRIPTESEIMGDEEFDGFLKRIDEVIERTEPEKLTKKD